MNTQLMDGLGMMKDQKTYNETIEVTLEEIKMATRPNVYRNRKKYTRKNKHKNDTESKTNRDV